MLPVGDIDIHSYICVLHKNGAGGNTRPWSITSQPAPGVVCMGQRKHAVFIPHDQNEERRSLNKAILAAYGMEDHELIITRMKSKEWNGEFVDVDDDSRISFERCWQRQQCG